MKKNTRRLLVILAVALPLLLLLWLAGSYVPKTLYFDSNGVAHGTGTKKYFYSSGALKLEDRYVEGQLAVCRA